jgi:putative membrane protein
MNKRNHTIATAAFAGLLTLAPAFAQNQGTTTSGTPENQGTTTGQGTTGSEHQGHDMSKMDKKGSMQVSSQDQKFMKDAAVGGMMEVELGRLATQKAANADVKTFGQRMVDDHSKANEQLKSLAAQKGVTLPTTLPTDMRQEMDKLSKLSGAAFDKMYMSHMLKDHKKDVAEFEKEASKASDSSLKSFAQQTLPTLREHLQMAQTIAPNVGIMGDDHTTHGKSGS